MQYLFGLRVHGIQQYIFQTNRLKEIVGASQLVDAVCTSFFKDLCTEQDYKAKKEQFILQAAGNVQYLFEDQTILCLIVRCLPQRMDQFAPGLSFSQAVVQLEEGLDLAIQLLDRRLEVQRNRFPMPLDQGFMALDRARRTGGVAYKREEQESKNLDRASWRKIAQQKENRLGLFQKFAPHTVALNRIPFDISDIVPKEKNSWLAIVHADGNSLGRLIHTLKESLKSTPDRLMEALATFSQQLDRATQEAAQVAFELVCKDLTATEKYPLRPVILGGDDLTIIIRADLALNFTTCFLRAFEKSTQRHFSFLEESYQIDSFSAGITACAGIAFAKATFPFHYSVHLVEELVKEAKSFSKAIDPNGPPSSLSFYKIMSSFTDDLSSMRKEQQRSRLTTKRYDVGPYLIEVREDYPDISLLESNMEILEQLKSDDSNSISKLHHYVTTSLVDEAQANFLLDRIKNFNPELHSLLRLELEGKENKASSLNDLLQLYAFKKTKKETKKN